MATKLLISGGPQLQARLASIPAGAPKMVAAWADDAAERMRKAAPPSRRPESKKFTTRARGLRAAVYGAFWWIFVDRGTKPHPITGAGAKNPPDSLKFTWGGRTIFSKKVNHPGQRARPFIAKAAQEALASSRLADLIVMQWNLRRLVGRTRFL